MFKNKIIVSLLFVSIYTSCVRTRAVYIEEDKKTVQSAIQLFIVRFNHEDYETIYDDANDVFKNANSKENIIPLMKETRNQNGEIVEVTDKLVRFFQGPPMQVRAIYNLKCAKGERSLWFTYIMGVDGKATLAEIQTFDGYSDISKYKNEESK